jgi:GNAT superfamily N-acetyltransferase
MLRGIERSVDFSRALIELIPMSDHLLTENIAVHPSHHGEGIGDKLLEHAEQRARSLARLVAGRPA